MASKPIKKKLITRSLIAIGILLLLLTGFHFWFKAHAKQMLEDLVESKSGGKLKMKVGKFKFGYFSKNMELDQVLFYNTDTINENTSYRFKVQKIKLKARGLLAIIFRNQFLIDSLSLYEPAIEVTRLNLSANKEDTKKDVSIPEEMGKIYKSIQDALSVLKVSRFRIENGKFTLINKIKPELRPISIGNLNFQIDNFLIDTGNVINKEKILFSDNVILTSSHQDIILPDSRHRISYKYFNINLKNKLVEFDSCTISATATDSSRSSFNVFFDKLLMTNIDFDTLYKSEVIKADSVYCVNPSFNLKVTIDKKKQADKEPLRLENIIKQLTGDLLLAHVVVSNADFNIETVQNGVPNSFTFSKNSFEMQGLTIDKGARKPIKVDQFVMAIRNYENFIKDSSYSIKFDSILFKDDRISLSNFLFEKLDNGKRVNSFRIPQFYLGGLSWDDLVFEKKLKADQATMFYPDIIYSLNPDKKKPGKQNIFRALGAVNEFMDLNYLEVVDGNIDLTIKKDLRLRLSRANLSIESNSLLSSKQISTIRNSLNSINFEKGKLQAGNLAIEIDDLYYLGSSGHFLAAAISVQDQEKEVNVRIKEVTVDKMIVDELTGNIDADGINWKNGTVDIAIHHYKKESAPSVIILKNIHGENTGLHITNNHLRINSTIREIALSKLENRPGKPIILEGLKTNGSDLSVTSENAALSISNYAIADRNTSIFKQVEFNSHTPETVIGFSAPSVSLLPDIPLLLKNDIKLADVQIERPVISYQLNTVDSKENTVRPRIEINSLRTNQPTIHFQVNDSSKTVFTWNGTLRLSSFLSIRDIAANAFAPGHTTIGEVKFDMSDFRLGTKGKSFYSDLGNIKGRLSHVQLHPVDTAATAWDGFIDEITASNFTIDNISQQKGTLGITSAGLKNLDISSSTVADIKKIISRNATFSLQQFTGTYTDSVNMIRWTNAAFQRDNNNFSLDSFSYHPALSRDSFLARQNFQKDYIHFTTGPIMIRNVDPDLYLEKNIVNASSMEIKNAALHDFKDKQIPFNPGIIKPLPVNLLKKIPFQIILPELQILNGRIEYTETSEKTKAAALIPVTRLVIRIKNIRNYNFQTGDSLQMEATGYLLDTALAHLQIKESYTDPNGGFLLQFKVSPADLKAINSVLIPLGSVQIASGFLDTLYAEVIGHEAMASGKMKLFYYDLKIQLLKNGKVQHFKSFLANTIVVRKNNSSRTGQIFFIRKRDRSAINYYVKIIGSGVASSIGAVNNKKQIRRYEKRQQKK